MAYLMYCIVFALVITVVKCNNENETKIKDIYRVVVAQVPPFVEVNGDHYSGYNIDLLEMIKHKLPFPFNYEMSEVKDGWYGNMIQGKWNGLMGDLVSNVTDVCLGPLSFTAERADFVDFTVPYFDLVGISILMKNDDDHFSLFKFIFVMEWPVWMAIGFAYLLTGFLLHCFDKFSPFSNTNDKVASESGRTFSFKESLWYCVTSLTPQGGGEAPKNLSGRLVALTWWLFGFIVVASYTANLAAFLTVPRLRIPISSFKDLEEQAQVKFAPVNGSIAANYFERLAQIEQKFYQVWQEMSLNESMFNGHKLTVWDYPLSDKYTKIWKTMKRTKLPKSTAEGIKRVVDGDKNGNQFALIGDDCQIRYLELTDCRLKQIGEPFAKKPYAIAFQKGSHLTEHFSKAILSLLNEHKLEELKQKWWTFNENRKNCPAAVQTSKGISIRGTLGIFVAIFAGLLLAFVTLLIEYVCYKRRNDSSSTEIEPIGIGNDSQINEKQEALL